MGDCVAKLKYGDQLKFNIVIRIDKIFRIDQPVYIFENAFRVIYSWDSFNLNEDCIPPVDPAYMYLKRLQIPTEPFGLVIGKWERAQSITVSPRTNVHALIFEDALSFRKYVHALIFEHQNKF